MQINTDLSILILPLYNCILQKMYKTRIEHNVLQGMKVELHNHFNTNYYSLARHCAVIQPVELGSNEDLQGQNIISAQLAGPK